MVKIKINQCRVRVGIICMFEGNAQLTVLPVAEMRQSLIVSGRILHGKFPIHAVVSHAVFFILRVIGITSFGNIGMGDTGESLLTEIYAVNLKTTLTVGIKDGIYTVIADEKFVDIVLRATFHIIITLATYQDIILTCTIEMIIFITAYKRICIFFTTKNNLSKGIFILKHLI